MKKCYELVPKTFTRSGVRTHADICPLELKSNALTTRPSWFVSGHESRVYRVLDTHIRHHLSLLQVVLLELLLLLYAEIGRPNLLHEKRPYHIT